MRSMILLPVAFAMMVADVPARAYRQSTGLDDLVGARAGQAEGELGRRGYRNVRGEKGDDRSYAYWWNAARGQCVTIATMNGRYDSITPTTAPDCRQRGNSPRETSRDRSDHPDLGYHRDSTRQEGPSYADMQSGFVTVAGQQVDLGLVCFGDGQRPTIATTYGWSWNSRRDRYDYGNRTELATQQFDASLMIQLWQGGGRIRLPKKLVPPINSRGSDGWWDLYDVSAGPDLIRAKYRLNGLNKPNITINRRSGQISVQGFETYNFRGTCDLIDGDDHRRF